MKGSFVNNKQAPIEPAFEGIEAEQLIDSQGT